MPLLVAVDPMAFGWGWLGNTQRYFQMAEALRELGWEFAVVTIRDNRRLTRQVEAAFSGRVFRTPFSLVPRLVDFRGGRIAWWHLVDRWSRRRTPNEERWAARLTEWKERYAEESPLSVATLLCAVSYRYWGPLLAVKSLAQELGVPYCVDLQDPLYDTGGTDSPTLSSERMRALVDAKRIVTTTATYAERLRELLPAHADKVECLRMTHNPLAPASGESPQRNGRLVLLHAGHLGGEPERSALPVLRAMARLYEQVPAARGRLTLRLVGRGRGIREAVDGAKALDLSRDLDCQPTVPPSMLQSYLDSADVLCVLKATVVRRDYQLPGKTYDYLFSPKPVLAVTFPGELADIIEATGAGFAVPPGDTDHLAAILGRLLEQKRATGTVALQRDPAKLHPYTAEAFRQKLENILAACVV